MADFVMPSLGADMEAGVLVGWLKQPGERVQRGDIVAEVETDKGIIEVEAFHSGVIEETLIQPGTKVPVGAVLARIREEGDATVSPPAAPEQPSVPERPAPPARERAVVSTARPKPQARIQASPAAKRLAEERGIDLQTIRASAPDGVITREDVLRAAPAPTAATDVARAPGVDQGQRIRQAIAAAMSRSKREIPHYYLSTTIDLHAATNWLAQHNAPLSVPERVLMGALFVKATALALREFPELNAVWENDRLQPRPGIHVGVAIALRQGGLIAPAIHDTDQQDLATLMSKLRDLTQRARAGGLRSSELADGTVTITSLGERGVEAVFGVIYPPQVALVGFGQVVERPWSVGGAIVSRQVVTATLSGDHRATDGHRGALFLRAVDRILQEPEKL